MWAIEVTFVQISQREHAYFFWDFVTFWICYYKFPPKQKNTAGNFATGPVRGFPKRNSKTWSKPVIKEEKWFTLQRFRVINL